jgi:hypothetical protein
MDQYCCCYGSQLRQNCSNRHSRDLACQLCEHMCWEPCCACSVHIQKHTGPALRLPSCFSAQFLVTSGSHPTPALTCYCCSLAPPGGSAHPAHCHAPSAHPTPPTQTG